MRVHVQNDPADPAFAITEPQWRAAAADEPPHAVSFAADVDGFAAARDAMELLVAPPAALRRLRPLVAPRLKLVFLNAAGVDAIAPFDWLPAGAVLLNNRGTHGPKAGEYVAMAALMLAARLPALAGAQHAGRWQPIHAATLAGRHALVIGTGDLGSAGARALRALGVRTTGVNTTGRRHPDFDAIAPASAIDALLPQADILVLACPLTPATHHLLDRRRLGLLPAHAGLVNIGRGELLEQDALREALAQGRLSGAVLDVVTPEPLPDGHPLWTTPNLIVTPHISCDDPATYSARSLAILFANLRAWRAGDALPNRVDLARGY
ncbi:MAG: D-2-hydroxyacid dehydrogenase [Alphaproteobacteria bacterium]|nr:D-2-hydroxyacid dehydrogenase [Alphaproteobacteria bacterium]